jgi:hypothetical protein
MCAPAQDSAHDFRQALDDLAGRAGEEVFDRYAGGQLLHGRRVGRIGMDGIGHIRHLEPVVERQG